MPDRIKGDEARLDLIPPSPAADNSGMEITGRIQNGVVVLEGAFALPEGARVTVLCGAAPAAQEPPKKQRVEFPLVHSKHPGSLHLTGQRIAEILDEEDAGPGR